MASIILMGAGFDLRLSGLSDFNALETRMPVSAEINEYPVLVLPHSIKLSLWVGQRGVAKAARKTNFWSDLVEKKQILNIAPPEGLFSSVKVDVDLANSAKKQPSFDERPLPEARNCFSRKWLAGYLGDIGPRLRNGGWKEDEISDMINTPASCFQKGSDSQNLVESFAFHVDLLSVSLRKASWSAKEVFESLDFDSKERKIPPQLDAKIGLIAEYLAKA